MIVGAQRVLHLRHQGVTLADASGFHNAFHQY
jgi:hypothetical protein